MIQFLIIFFFDSSFISLFRDLTVKERHAPTFFQQMGDVSKTHSEIQPISKRKGLE